MSGRFLDGRGEDPSELQWAAMTPYREAMPRLRTTLVLAVAVGCALVSGCAVQGATGAAPTATGRAVSENPTTAPSTSTSTSPPSPTDRSTLLPGSTTTPPAPRPPVLASDGKPRVSRLSIPSLGIKNLRVKPHRGSPDDAGGTRIQNRGIAASPYGPDGGVGPGGTGNHIVTAHRLSSTRAFLNLPKLRVGAKVHVVAGGQRYTYRIIGTQMISFRSKKSLAAQVAEVPGRTGVRATKAMITLSTCRTPEDRAEGNYWSDEFGNPEHRIDKIGELVAIRPG
ncbi:MAG: sortase [Propionibacteriaceae bacterium]|jgi:sortase A|nr:sortase [Propionibacteriaceae bacterium]